MRSSSIRTLVVATPATRDRTVDLLQAGGNVLALVPAAQPATWTAQVMPLLFLAGGRATASSWRSSVRAGTPAVVRLRAPGPAASAHAR